MVCAPHNFMLSLLQKTTLALPLMKSVRPCENLSYVCILSGNKMRVSYCFDDHKDTHFVTSLESPSFKKFLLCRSKELLCHGAFSVLLLPLLLLWRKFGLIYQLLRRKGLLFVAGHGCGFQFPHKWEGRGRRRRLFDHIKIRRRTCETNVVFATSTLAKYVTDIPFFPFLEVNSPDGKRQELSTF